VLLAKSLQGYRNLLTIVSKGSLDNPGQTPTIDFSYLQEYKASLPQRDLELVCLSGSASSEIAYYILS